MKECNLIVFFVAPVFVSTYGDSVITRSGRKMYFNSCTCGENVYTDDLMRPFDDVLIPGHRFGSRRSFEEKQEGRKASKSRKEKRNNRRLKKRKKPRK